MKLPVWINVELFPVKNNLCWNDVKPQHCWASPLPGGCCWRVVFCWVIYVTHHWFPQSSLNVHNCNFNRWIWRPLSVKSWANSHFNPHPLPLSPPCPFGAFMVFRCSSTDKRGGGVKSLGINSQVFPGVNFNWRAVRYSTRRPPESMAAANKWKYFSPFIRIFKSQQPSRCLRLMLFQWIKSLCCISFLANGSYWLANIHVSWRCCYLTFIKPFYHWFVCDSPTFFHIYFSFIYMT